MLPRRAFARAAGALRVALAIYWPFAACLALALALRLAVIPPRMVVDLAPLVADEGNYFSIAESLAAGNGVPDQWPWIRPPGYPLLLAALLRLTGGDLRAMFVVQAVAGTALVLVVALLAGRLWGRRAAFAAALAAALHPSLVYYTRLLHAETFYTLLLALLALCLVRWARGEGEGTTGWVAVGAVAAGLAATLRPAVMTLLPLLAGWLLWRAWRRGGPAPALRQVALFTGLWLVVLSPVTLYNWRTYDRFILVDTTLGYTFWRDHRDGSIQELNRTLVAIPNPGDRQAFALRQGLAWVRAHPTETLRKGARSLQVAWGEPFYVDDAIAKRPGLSDLWRNGMHLLTLLLWLALMPLAFLGAWRARDPAPLVPLGLIGVAGPSVGIALSHPENRFLLPSLPLLIALAAGLLASRAGTARTRRRALGAAASIALFFALAYSVSGAWLGWHAEIAAHYGLGRAAEWAGQGDAAARQYTAVAARNPALSEPHLRLATLARARGDDAAALAAVEQALDRDANNFRARGLGVALLRAGGRDAEAQRLLLSSGAATAPEGLEWAWQHERGAPPARLALDGGDSGFARGFYAAEQGGGRAFRWMGDRAWLRLAPPSGAAPPILALTLANPPATGETVAVTVLVNGREAGRPIVSRERGWNEARLALPPGTDLTRPLTIELRAPVVRVAGDRRAFGVAVASAALEPAP